MGQVKANSTRGPLQGSKFGYTTERRAPDSQGAWCIKKGGTSRAGLVWEREGWGEGGSEIPLSKAGAGGPRTPLPGPDPRCHREKIRGGTPPQTTPGVWTPSHTSLGTTRRIGRGATSREGLNLGKQPEAPTAWGGGAISGGRRSAVPKIVY